MAEAKQAGGLYYTADGTPVDANGEAVKGAPARAPNTDPSKQPGAPNALTPEERMGLAIAQAITNPAALVAKAQAAEAAAAIADDGEGTDSDEEEGLPPLAEMEPHLAGISDADEVKALQKQDKRKGAKPLYKARLAEIAAE